MIVVTGDKNDWQHDPRMRQGTAQFDAGPVPQIDIENDAEGLVEVPVKGLCQGEQHGFKTVLQQLIVSFLPVRRDKQIPREFSGPIGRGPRS
jgi:hypothetical protein